MLTAEQVAESFSKRFASQEEMDAWLLLLDKFFAMQIATAAARRARLQAASATQEAEAVAQAASARRLWSRAATPAELQAEAVAQAASARSATAQAEFDELAAALAA